MNILFILPVLSDSYYRKHVEKISELGADCSVVGFDRDYYEGKPWSIETKSLGYIEHEHYLRRLGTLFTSIFQIHKASKNHDVLYAFNLDILFISWLAALSPFRTLKIVYDVADIRPILVQDGLVPVMLRALERFLIKRTSVVVVASPAYIDGYFNEILKVDHNFLVIENKLDKNHMRDLPEPDKSEKKKEAVTIGYFGILRCEHSLRVLKQLVQNGNGSVRLLLRGAFLNTEHFEDEFKDLDYASYDGTFVYPDDLGEMFASVDLVWGAHLQSETNIDWSILNRFYQACYFKRPLIVQEGTQNEKLVNKFDIGVAIDLNDPEKAAEKIRAIDHSQIKEWRKNMRQVPEQVYIFTDEHERLLQEIKKH